VKRFGLGKGDEHAAVDVKASRPNLSASASASLFLASISASWHLAS